MRGGGKGGGVDAWLVTAGAVSCIDLVRRLTLRFKVDAEREAFRFAFVHWRRMGSRRTTDAGRVQKATSLLTST